MHLVAMEAGDLVGRRQRLAVEERGQFVVGRGEAGLPVELSLVVERLAAELLEELCGQVGIVRRVERVGQELQVDIGDALAEDAQPQRIVGGHLDLLLQAQIHERFQRPSRAS